MQNDFDFGFFGFHIQAHDWEIVAATVVALALIAIIGMAICRLSSRDLLALARCTISKSPETVSPPTLSSPAEKADAPRTEECEGRGIQVGTPTNPRRIDRVKLQKAKQAALPGSPSLARSGEAVPNNKQRAARARRG